MLGSLMYDWYCFCFKGNFDTNGCYLACIHSVDLDFNGLFLKKDYTRSSFFYLTSPPLLCQITELVTSKAASWVY